jgi:diguanylate cyclase (GGDEF)-like protein
MDLVLPGTSGVELAREVRENPAYTNVPIVFLTAERSPTARIEAVGVGADDYITKPANPDLLRAVVDARLKRSRSVQALIEHDALTGALTRGGFFRRTELAVNASRRRGEPLALVMLDLDHFKNINDRYGHLTGDRVLVAFVAYLKRHLRAGDEIGRYGGEEFVLLLRNVESSKAQDLVARLIHEFGRIPQRALDGTAFYVTFSGGVAMWEPECDPQTWRQRADEALYAAKHHGRARVEAA